MDKKQLKQLLEQDHIKKDKMLHFQLKACEIVTDKYGGEPNEWYLSGVDDPNDENIDKNKKKIRFNRIKDNKLDLVLVECEYNPSNNKKVISTFKSSISFRHIVGIEVDSEKILISTSFRQYTYQHLYPFRISDEPFDKFHKVLIRKFDEYCDVEYNYFKQH